MSWYHFHGDFHHLLSRCRETKQPWIISYFNHQPSFRLGDGYSISQVLSNASSVADVLNQQPRSCHLRNPNDGLTKKNTQLSRIIMSSPASRCQSQCSGEITSTTALTCFYLCSERWVFVLLNPSFKKLHTCFFTFFSWDLQVHEEKVKLIIPPVFFLCKI